MLKKPYHPLAQGVEGTAGCDLKTVIDKEAFRETAGQGKTYSGGYDFTLLADGDHYSLRRAEIPVFRTATCQRDLHIVVAPLSKRGIVDHATLYGADLFLRKTEIDLK